MDDTTKVVFYDIDWNQVRRIKDLKVILQVLATKVVIDHNDPDDNIVYDTLKDILIKSKNQSE